MSLYRRSVIMSFLFHPLIPGMMRFVSIGLETVKLPLHYIFALFVSAQATTTIQLQIASSFCPIVTNQGRVRVTTFKTIRDLNGLTYAVDQASLPAASTYNYLSQFIVAEWSIILLEQIYKCKACIYLLFMGYISLLLFYGGSRIVNWELKLCLDRVTVHQDHMSPV